MLKEKHRWLLLAAWPTSFWLLRRLEMVENHHIATLQLVVVGLYVEVLPRYFALSLFQRLHNLLQL